MLNKNSVNINIPSSISYMWNFGSLLGFFFFLQIVSGLLLVMNYMNFSVLTFDYCVELFFDYNNGWLLHNLHANGASILFSFMYAHMWRGLMYSSYTKKLLWWSGLILLVVNMVTAFLGYVLPWGQMSYWGTTVITGLITVIPYIGYDLLNYIWGDKIVSPQTLSRFMVLHFITPFILLAVMLIHMGMLHSYGSNNPFGLHNKINTMKFNPLYTIKDSFMVLIMMMLFMLFVMGFPIFFLEVVNSVEANPMMTPSHIQPEWYFLFAYAILRSIPNKVGGVIALISSILVFVFFTYSTGYVNKSYNKLHMVLFFIFLMSFMILTLMGATPVVEPYVFTSQVASMVYFGVSLLFIL